MRQNHRPQIRNKTGTGVYLSATMLTNLTITIGHGNFIKIMTLNTDACV